MKSVCKPDGIILVIVPSFWPFHGYPCDFWRFEPTDIEKIFSDCKLLTVKEDRQKPSLVYVKMSKPENFVEKDLSDYELHRVIVNKRVKEVADRDFRSWHFRRLRLLRKVKDFALKIGKNLYLELQRSPSPLSRVQLIAMGSESDNARELL
jgi:hypothetical protein